MIPTENNFIGSDPGSFFRFKVPITCKFPARDAFRAIPGWKLRQLLNKRLSDYRRTYVAAKLWRLI